MGIDSLQSIAERYKSIGDNKSLLELQDILVPRLKSFTERYLRSKFDPDLIEDVYYRSFYKAVLSIDSYKPELGMFSTWAFTICKNECFQELESRKRYVSVDKMNDRYFDGNFDISMIENIHSDYELEYINITSMEDEEEELRKKTIITLVLKTIHEELTDLYRDILFDREFKNMQYSELSVKYMLPMNTIKNNIHKARIRIRGILEDRIKKIDKFFYGE